MQYKVCVHSAQDPKCSIVINPITFEPLCGCCRIYVKDFPKVNPTIEAYNRAMKGIK